MTEQKRIRLQAGGSMLLFSALVLAASFTVRGGIVVSPAGSIAAIESASDPILDRASMRRSLSRHMLEPKLSTAVVPETSTYIAGALLALPFAVGGWRRFRTR